MPLSFRAAVAADAPVVLVLVRSAYRGESSRVGWTTEADLLADDRIDEDEVLAKITDPEAVVLLAEGDDAVIACCEVVRRDAGTAYFGMFAVRPELQAAGIGRVVLARAEAEAVERWTSTRMEMTVISARTDLIAWYERRGYRVTGERRPFRYDRLVNGVALRDDLEFAVLVKEL